MPVERPRNTDLRAISASPGEKAGVEQHVSKHGDKGSTYGREAIADRIEKENGDSELIESLRSKRAKI